jgi:hypothetical protein
LYIPLNNGVSQLSSYGALNPYINQFMASTNTWSVDASIDKNFHVTERVQLRVQLDAFNVLNVQGNSPSPGSYGVAYTSTSYNTPRQLQLGAHLNW